MGYHEYQKLTSEQLLTLQQELAFKFLPIYDGRLLDLKDRQIIKRRNKWFAVESDILGEQTPRAPGYYLGYAIIKRLIESNRFTFEQLLRIDLEDVAAIIHSELKQMIADQS